MNYSRFGAICEVESAKAERKRSESASVRPYRNRDVAPLFAPKESRVPYISSQEKCFKCVIIHERPTNVCILPGF